MTIDFTLFVKFDECLYRETRISEDRFKRLAFYYFSCVNRDDGPPAITHPIVDSMTTSRLTLKLEAYSFQYCDDFV
jgi:hypothetical protein